MAHTRHGAWRALFALILLLALSPFARSQGYPDKPITLVVPFPPGAVTDRVGRDVGAELSRRLGQPVVVENVAGASGMLGAKRVLRAPADGYTLLMGTVNDMVVAPVVMKADYSAVDFTPITKVSSPTTVLVAHASFPANTAEELVAHARKSTAPIPLGVTGVAMLQTIGGEMFAAKAGFKFTLVPYKGGAPLLHDLVGGQVPLATVALPSALPLIREGKLKSLGILSTHRDPAAPELPTVNEGRSVKGVEADLWLALVGPPRLPAAVVARLSAAMREVLADRAFRDAQMRAGSVLVDYEEPEAFGRFLAGEQERVRELAAHVKSE
ncbi:MAG TPA: tripartite tricarboxylate transporter substrate binding protein [Albitalea sp.]|uniref:Bug family tripartite tricarboxylate transporter substrate binding protein n=1 Tax=Piscinibacter sp. TaxID=1903157 RepID=UPI002ED0C469